MPSNVITFTASMPRQESRRIDHDAGNTVVSFARWLSRGVPRRTPTGVFFTTRPAFTAGEIL